MLVRALHQAEITSRCNLRCKYCVHPKMPRPKVDMSMQTFERVLHLVKGYHAAGTQRELSMHGIGESLVHPQFAEMVVMARRELPNIDLTLATNGVIMDDEIAGMLAVNRVRTWVSLHRPERAGPAIEALKRQDILAGVSADPSVAAVDWAGQVDWHVSAAPNRCMWLAQGMAIAFADGRIGTCGFDGQGTDGVIGTVYDAPQELRVKPYSLCDGCNQIH